MKASSLQENVSVAGLFRSRKRHHEREASFWRAERREEIWLCWSSDISRIWRVFRLRNILYVKRGLGWGKEISHCREKSYPRYESFILLPYHFDYLLLLHRLRTALLPHLHTRCVSGNAWRLLHSFAACEAISCLLQHFATHFLPAKRSPLESALPFCHSAGNSHLLERLSAFLTFLCPACREAPITLCISCVHSVTWPEASRWLVVCWWCWWCVL